MRAGSTSRAKGFVVGALALVLVALGGSAFAHAAKPSYVALGDSFTAGPLIPVQIPPFGCLKSSNDYPHLAAPDLKVPALRDASCSGAKTVHMTQPQNVQPAPNPPQFDRLDADTRIVTVGIGGNDIGFSEIIGDCRSDTPDGRPCQDRFVVDGRDEISARIEATAPKIAEVLAGIRARSPRADVYVVNYLPILPEPEYDLAVDGPGCWPQVPFAHDDVPYLRAKQNELNAMLAREAAAGGATIVDANAAGGGRDACQVPLVRWVEPAAPASAAAPFHPNLFGMRGTERALLEAVRSN